MARKKKNLKDEIKEMEAKKREESLKEVKTEKEVSFDSWYAQRKDKIKSCHKKEILRADFTARGYGKTAKIEDFDKALELYGVKLK